MAVFLKLLFTVNRIVSGRGDNYIVKSSIFPLIEFIHYNEFGHACNQ